MTEHKTDISIAKLTNSKKLNMAEHKTDMNITKIDKYKKTDHDTTQNRREHY